MGIIHVTVSVSALTRDGLPFEADFLVDTGAINSMAPRDRLLEAGVRVEGKAMYELANGEPVEYEYGFARMCFLGLETVGRIIFGSGVAEPRVGVLALGDGWVVFDPPPQHLKQLHIRPLK